MPTYEYQCQACEDYFTTIHSMNAKPLTRCTNCGKDRLKRLISAPHISTPDTFGVKKAFYDEKTGKTIDTFKKWEKAGFRDIADIPRSEMRDKAMAKQKRCKSRGDRAVDPANLPI